jgi:hypothetical protein
MNDHGRPLPVPDEDSAPYWQGANEGKLLLQFCADCGKPRFYPRKYCPFCSSAAVEWREASGRGTVYTYAIVNRAPLPVFAASLPYAVGLIDLAEGVRMYSTIDAADGALAIGAPVAVYFDAIDEGVTLPRFRVVAS